MSGIQRRSRTPQNITEFRHPAFYEGRPEWDAAAAAYEQYRAALAAWSIEVAKGEKDAPTPPKPKEVAAPDVTMYRGTERDVVWRMLRVKTGFETDEIVGLMTSMAIDWQGLAKQVAEGDENAIPRISEPQRSAYRRAELTVMTTEFVGDFFEIPPDFTQGDYDRSEDATPHPLAGQMMPVDPQWLRLLGTERVSNDDLLAAAHLHLIQSYERRSEEAEATFPSEPVSLADARDAADRRGTKRAGKPAVS